MRKVKKETEVDYYQMMFRSFLRALREEKNWTKQELADALEVSLPTVEKFEGKNPTRIPEIVLYMRKFANLKGISVNSFLSIVMGKLNEEGEAGGAFARELAADIEKLDNVSQSKLKAAIKLSQKCESSVEVYFNVSQSSIAKKKLYMLLTDLSEEHTKILIPLIEELRGRA
jgi:transcriptional regulator with XRE-family HTH domain